MDTITIAGIERGLSMADIRRMTIGEIVDFCVEWQNGQTKEEKVEEKRKATQADWNAFLG